MIDDYDSQMIYGDLVGLKLPDIQLTGEEKPRKNLTQETCPDRGSNPGPLREKPHATTILPEKFLGYSRESNPEPLGWQSDVLTTIPNRWSIIYGC